MPTYTYECKCCNTITEVKHGMLEDPTISCKSCGEETTRVILSAPAFDSHFVGSVKNPDAFNGSMSKVSSKHLKKGN